MYRVNCYMNNRKVLIDEGMENIPRVGDTMRLPGNEYGKVTEIVWRMDETTWEGQRVDLLIEEEQESAE